MGHRRRVHHAGILRCVPLRGEQTVQFSARDCGTDTMYQADVISASVGEASGFSDTPWAVVAGRIVDQGVVVVISAGNGGIAGPFYTSSGSNGHNVLSVAAINVSTHAHINRSDPRWTPMAASFTSWGPTAELLLKPDIGAPGLNIISTWPNQSYEMQSGTSMAAPYIAGVAALYIGEHGGRAQHGPEFAKHLGRRIASSGKAVAWHAGTARLDRLAPPFQVGTGLVDAWKVLRYDTALVYEPFALLDTESFEPVWNATIVNRGNELVTYSFVLEPHAGIEIEDDQLGVASLFGLKPIKAVPSVILPLPITVRSGQARIVK